MKLFKLILVCFFLSAPIYVFTQANPVIIKCYVHTIRKNNGNGGAPIADFLDEFERLKQNYAQLQKEKEDLNLKYQELEKEVQELKKENAYLKEINTLLRK